MIERLSESVTIDIESYPHFAPSLPSCQPGMAALCKWRVVPSNPAQPSPAQPSTSYTAPRWRGGGGQSAAQHAAELKLLRGKIMFQLPLVSQQTRAETWLTQGLCREQALDICRYRYR